VLPFLRATKRPAAPWWVFIFGIFPPRFWCLLPAKGLAAREKGPFRLLESPG
jgi:hypothetical protein